MCKGYDTAREENSGKSSSMFSDKKKLKVVLKCYKDTKTTQRCFHLRDTCTHLFGNYKEQDIKILCGL